MKKVQIYDEIIIKNPDKKKHSQPIYFEDRDESVSLVQIGNKINVVSPLVCSKLQQKAANALIRHLKNNDE
jgi:hypothetical protein